MSHVTGIFVVDAPASALNNSGKDPEARTDNAVAVKQIRAPDGRYPYVSAQAVRYWLRTLLASEAGWTASPVFREDKVAYTDGDPTRYAEDDLFGYMRAASTSTDEKKAAKRAAIAEKAPAVKDVKAIMRISPFRVGTLVSVAPVKITGDFGTMSRQEGDPVPHEHQFYRAHLKAPFGIDLTCAGTFFDSKRTGYVNVDENRIASAKANGATEVEVRGFRAWRLPLAVRRARVAQLVRGLARLEGGAKQALHLTDTAPAVLVLATCKSGNQPFQRLVNGSELGMTELRPDVLLESLKTFGADLQSAVYIGWARGFLDTERKKLEALLASDAALKDKIVMGHPREVAESFAGALLDAKNDAWFT